MAAICEHVRPVLQHELERVNTYPYVICMTQPLDVDFVHAQDGRHLYYYVDKDERHDYGDTVVCEDCRAALIALRS